jgi:hypothetical protein
MLIEVANDLQELKLKRRRQKANRREEWESVVKEAKDLEDRRDKEYVINNILILVQWSEFLATDPEVTGSIPGVTRISEK